MKQDSITSNAFGDGATLLAGSHSKTDPPGSLLGRFARRCLEVAPRGVVRRLNRISRSLAKYSGTLLGDELGNRRAREQDKLAKRRAREEDKPGNRRAREQELAKRHAYEQDKLAKRRAREQDKLAKRRAREQPIAVSMTAGDVRFKLWLPPNSRFKYQQLSVTGGVYEPVMLACLTRVLQQASTSRFMDIGAYVGYYACYVSALFAGREEVYAIESNPLYANAARETARLNGFTRMLVFQEALSNRVEPVKIQHTAVCHNSAADDDATMALTLDALCKREQLRPTIVKMDVHGAEGKIVLGMRSVLADVEGILLEMHKLSILREYSPGITRTALLDALEDAGLTLYHVAGHRESAAFQELLSGKGFCYRRLDRQVRSQTLFDGHDFLLLGLRHGEIESLLGPSISPANE